MMERFRIAQFLQQLHANCLVGKTIKIHALTQPVGSIHLQQRAKYAWYAAKLISHEVISSDSQVAHLDEIKTVKCECRKQAK